MITSKYTQSTKILRSLIEGVHPESGEELPKDGVLNRSDVMRALLSAVAALDAIAARENRRALLPHSVGKAWSEDEESTLRMEFQQGAPLTVVAQAHGRTLRAIESRLVKMGLLTTAERVTTDATLLHASQDKNAAD